MPDKSAVLASWKSHSRSQEGTYDPRYDSWLLARVDGQMTGTTDEIFQWAACKWGLPDNLLRGVAFRESTWYQYLTYPTNRCVTDYGCGDIPSGPSAQLATYCSRIAEFGYDYRPDYTAIGPGVCPRTFSIAGVMSYDGWRPDWADTQNGTFPFSRDSTAFAVDYMASSLRGCYEGWVWWLTRTSGDLMGCVGDWYAGDWHSAKGDAYARAVQEAMDTRPWLGADFAWKPGCSQKYGCPGTDSL